MTYPKVIFTSNKTLDSIAGKQGQFLVCRDTERVYIDVTDNKRLDISGKIFEDIMSNIDMSETIKDFNITGQTVTITLGDGTTKTFTTQDNDTTYSPATESANGLMSSAAFNKLNKNTTDIVTLSNKITDVENKIPIIPTSLPGPLLCIKTWQTGIEPNKYVKILTATITANINIRYYANYIAMIGDTTAAAPYLISLNLSKNAAYYSIAYGVKITALTNATIGIEIDKLGWMFYESNTVTDDNIVYELYAHISTNYDRLQVYDIGTSSWNSTNVALEFPDMVLLDSLPEGEYTTVKIDSAFHEINELKSYIGYTDNDIYGLEADFENNKFTRLAGAVGKNPGADFDSVNAFGGRRRCALSNDGAVNSYFGEEDWSEPDGWNESLSQNEQCMVEQPKFYYKVVPLKTEKIVGADGYHIRKARYYISDTPKPGFKVHPAFVQNGIEIDKIYLSAYEGAIQDVSAIKILLNDEQVADFDTDKMVSISGVKPASGTTQALTRANARKLAQNRGAGWGIMTIQTLSATQLLFAIEYATFNSQTAIGNGVVNATETIRTGSTSSLGNASGSVESGGVSYRGEENLWGNINTFIDGYDPIGDSTHIISTISSNDKIKMYSLKKNGYISSFNYNPDLDWCFIPCDKNGNSSLPVGDMAYGQTTAIGKIVPVFGGDWSHDSYNGLFCLYTVWEYANHRNTNGVRLIYIPTEVTAND